MKKPWQLCLALSLLALPALAQDDAALCREEAQRGQVKACQKAIAATPRDPELHALLGQAYFASGLYHDGLQALRDAVIASNGAAEHRYRFAGFAALINEYPKAAQELEMVVADQPDHLKAWMLLADCYRYMKNRPAAQRAGRKAAELGDPAEAYILAGRYNSGDGVRVDPVEELRWLERSAKGGYVAAIQDLVRLYTDGRPGIPPDAVKRDYWHRKAKKLK